MKYEMRFGIFFLHSSNPVIHSYKKKTPKREINSKIIELVILLCYFFSILSWRKKESERERKLTGLYLLTLILR